MNSSLVGYRPEGGTLGKYTEKDSALDEDAPKKGKAKAASQVEEKDEDVDDKDEAGDGDVEDRAKDLAKVEAQEASGSAEMSLEKDREASKKWTYVWSWEHMILYRTSKSKKGNQKPEPTQIDCAEKGEDEWPDAVFADGEK